MQSCVMNANEISPKTNARLNRIQMVSRIVRYVILANIILNLGFWLIYASPLSGSLGRSVLLILLQALVCVWFWKLAQLFHYYERGLIFASETIHCIKTLGLLCVINWLLMTMAGRFLSHPVAAKLPMVLPPDVKVVTTMVKAHSFGFFSFNIAGVNFGMLLAGIIIVLIAWIMDEGRKIQEEQELTV